MNEKCNDRYIFQTNRIPTWIPHLTFKYQNMYWVIQNDCGQVWQLCTKIYVATV
jgi:hypothetical protein